MSPRDSIERVIDVLQCADSLFVAPQAPAGGTPDNVQHAAEATNTLASHAGDISGALVDAHRDVLTSIAQRLSEYADTDAHLVEQLTQAADNHAQSAARAAEVAGEATDTCEAVGEWSEVPAAEIAALMTLRRAVAEMQALMTQQVGDSMRTTEDIVTLGYE